MSNPLKKLSSQKGQGTVEFALVFVLFLVLVLAIFDFMRVCYFWAGEQYAVNEAARDGMLHGNQDLIRKKFNVIADIIKIPKASLTFESLGGVVPKPTDPLPALNFFVFKASAVVPLTILGPLRSLIGLEQDDIAITASTIIRNEPYG